MIVFNTRRLTIRRWHDSDLSEIFTVYSDHAAMRWVGSGKPLKREDCLKWLEVTYNNYQKRGYGMFTVEGRPNHEIMGFCGLVHPGDQLEPEVKYAYHRSYWGKGYATEVVAGLLEYGASKHGLTRIIATTSPENIASHKVLIKAGMQFGALRNNDDGSKTQLFFWHS